MPVQSVEMDPEVDLPAPATRRTALLEQGGQSAGGRAPAGRAGFKDHMAEAGMERQGGHGAAMGSERAALFHRTQADQQLAGAGQAGLRRGIDESEPPA